MSIEMAAENGDIPAAKKSKADLYTNYASLIKGSLAFFATVAWFGSTIDEFFHATGEIILGYSWPALVAGIIMAAVLVFCDTYCHWVQDQSNQSEEEEERNTKLPMKLELLLAGSAAADTFGIAGVLTGFIFKALPMSSVGKIIALLVMFSFSLPATRSEYRTHRNVLLRKERIEREEAALEKSELESRAQPSATAVKKDTAVAKKSNADFFTNYASFLKGSLAFLATIYWFGSMIDELFHAPGNIILGYSWPALVVGVVMAGVLVFCDTYCHRAQDHQNQESEEEDAELPTTSQLLLTGSVAAETFGVAGALMGFIFKMIAMSNANKIIALIVSMLVCVPASRSDYRTKRNVLLKEQRSEHKESPSESETVVRTSSSWCGWLGGLFSNNVGFSALPADDPTKPADIELREGPHRNGDSFWNQCSESATLEDQSSGCQLAST